MTLEVSGKTSTELWALMPLLSNRSKGLNSRSLIGAAGGKKENPISLTEGMGKKKQNTVDGKREITNEGNKTISH